MVDTRSNYTLFDGRRAHRVEPFQGGDRYSLVFFSVAGWARGPRHELPDGAVYPTDESLRYFSSLIAPARGNAGSILAAFGRQPKAQILCWPRTSLHHLTSTCIQGIAAAANCRQALRAVSRRVASAFPSRLATRHVVKAKRPRNDAQALSFLIDAWWLGSCSGASRILLAIYKNVILDLVFSVFSVFSMFQCSSFLSCVTPGSLFVHIDSCRIQELKLPSFISLRRHLRLRSFSNGIDETASHD